VTMRLVLATAVCAIGAAAGVVALVPKSPASRANFAVLPAAAATAPGFVETKWPFPMDQWGLGRAFRCGAQDCGVAVDLYLRPKIGFCNCATGVADDEELERVGDVELLNEKFSAPAPGHPIAVAWMKGRGRIYDVPGRAAGATLSLAFNDHCDVIVAVATVPDGSAARVEPAVLGFLNSAAVIGWARQVLGL